MASDTSNPNPEAREFVKSIKLRANHQSSSSSSSSPASDGAIDRRSERFLVQNHGNFRISGIPARIMFYRDGTWTEYPSRVVDSLRSGFSERKSVLDLAVEGSSYVFDFLRMLQINISTGCRRSIAWIDDGGKCFFPKEFDGGDEFDSAAEIPDVEIEIRITVGSEQKLGKRVREFEGLKEENEVTSKCEIRDESKRPRLGDSGWPNAKFLGEGDKGFASISSIVSAEIRKLHPGAAITAIHRCTRSGLLEKARSSVFSNQMEITKAARGTPNVVFAWYSASRKDILGVLAHGFGVSNGDSVYLSPLGQPCTRDVQSDENGERHLMLCAVILGKLEKVEAGSQQRYPSSAEFDTGADDPNNPKWYVVWPTNVSRHILPECVVSYKSSDCLPAKVGGIPHTKYTFPQLFTKVKSALSPVKVQECMNLFEKLKSGTIAKDLFIKRFRDIAGEKVLRSAIQEICGMA